jgi:AbrB family looped-hinge helix DNA binding protein
MTRSRTVQVRGRGTVTLPARIRERYDLGEGDPLTLVDLDGAILLSPKTSIADKLSAEIEYLRTEAGLSLEELLGGLREQRAQYHAERLGRR